MIDDLSFFKNAIAKVREISLRSGESQGEVRGDESRKKVATLVNFFGVSGKSFDEQL